VTIFLDIVPDVLRPDPVDAILSSIESVWQSIPINLTVALGPNTADPLLTFAGIHVERSAAPQGTAFFKLTVGYGASADPGTRAGQISYVNVSSGTATEGTGYIYNLGTDTNLVVDAVAHEIAHIMGLTDRYYEGVYWLSNWSVNRTCKQIRNAQYGTGAASPTGSSDNLLQLPRLAVRHTLPMSELMITDGQSSTIIDTNYDPNNNLMSTSSAVLTNFQIDSILYCNPERTYRTRNWVAVLGQWKESGGTRAPAQTGHDHRRYPAWEARPQDDGQGLIASPTGQGKIRYPCVARLRRGKDENGHVVRADTLAIALGRSRLYLLPIQQAINTIGYNSSYRMCHLRNMIRDLQNI
jgi:hypothetical protein